MTIHVIFIQEVEAHLLHFGLISSVWGLTLLCVVFTAEVLRACRSDRWSVGKAGLHDLHVIGREHSKMAIWAVASPPALVYHLNPGNDVVGVERDLCVIS